MTPVEILQGARVLIENDRDEFICLAVKSAAGFYGNAYDQGWLKTTTAVSLDQVLSHIRKLLNGCFTLDSWLSKNHTELVKTPEGCDIEDATYKQKIRETRLAWIDDMIRYFKEQEQ